MHYWKIARVNNVFKFFTGCVLNKNVFPILSYILQKSSYTQTHDGYLSQPATRDSKPTVFKLQKYITTHNPGWIMNLLLTLHSEKGILKIKR